MLSVAPSKAVGGLLRPPLRRDTARGLWDLRWKEHFTTVNISVQFLLPFTQDLSTALSEAEDAPPDAPEPDVMVETKRSLYKSIRSYARTTAKQGLCITVGCLLMTRDRNANAYHQSVPRNLVYYWDTLGCQMPIYFAAELLRGLNMPESVVRLMGVCPAPEHIEYSAALADTMAGAALLSLRESWIPMLADVVVESGEIIVRHRRQRKKMVTELFRTAVDKVVMAILQCLLAALGSRLHPNFGTFWVEVIGAMFLKGVVTKAAQRALRLPPPDAKGGRPALEAAGKQRR